MFISFRTCRFALLSALVVASGGAGSLFAQADIERPHPINNAEHPNRSRNKPYNFTGRVFVFDDTFGAGIASATLVRRHTALTAGHVVFEPTAGFLTRATFSRALYGSYSLQKLQVVGVSSLTGYSDAAVATGPNSYAAFERDLGYLVLTTPPIDEDWGVTTTDTTTLTATTTPSVDFGRFVLGYPGVTFDGRTMAYIVPTTPYVEIGGAGSGEFENDEYSAEEGMSGGPVYVYTQGVQQIIGETVGGIDDTSGAFNASIIHALNAEATQFIANAEYQSGLIKKVKIKGPATVARGSTVTFTATPKFAVPALDPAFTPHRPTTTRYSEIQLVSDTPGTPTNPAVTITKTSNTTFQVKFGTTLRSRSRVILTASNAENTVVGNSSFAVTVQ